MVTLIFLIFSILAGISGNIALSIVFSICFLACVLDSGFTNLIEALEKTK